MKRFRNQEVIQWWYEYNPVPEGEIKFVLLPKSARFIEMHDAHTGKLKTPLFTASFIKDNYNNDIVLVKNISTKKYSLAFCCTNPNDEAGTELTGISLCEGNTIFLEFTGNGKTIKRKLNLATKKLL